MNNRFISAVLSALSVSIISTAFTGCNFPGQDNKVYNIGICQFTTHDALDAAGNGFTDALTEMLGDRVDFSVSNAYGITENCASIISHFSSDEVDLIMANATTALAEASKTEDEIPIVATAVTDYSTALGIENWTGTSGTNVTGTSDLAPLELQAEMVKNLIPEAKTVGILYCKNETNSLYQVEQICPFFNSLGLKTKEYSFTLSAEIASATRNAIKECDVLYIPTDNMVAANAEFINSITEPAKFPVITGGAEACLKCGIATLSINYYDIGYRAGEMAYDILENGYNPADMKIEYADTATKYAVRSRAEKIGIKIPDDYLDLE